jgi:hypothetical protein
MLPVSSDFLTAINGPGRNFHAFTELIFNEGISASATASAGTNVDNVCDGLFRPTDYNSVGSIVKQPAPGWRGAAMSDNNGVITPEVITVSYAPSVSSKNLWVIARMANYPVNFTVEIKENNTWSTLANIVGNTSWFWFMRLDTVHNIQAFRLTITKISTNASTALITECGVINSMLLCDDDVTYETLLVEACSESRNPVGNVTSNELTVDINNENRWYNLTTANSPANMIKPGVKSIAHIGIQIPNGDFEFTILGTFYLTDWSAPSSTSIATMTANDRLMKMMDLPAQNKMPLQNVTVKALFEYLFTSIGLTQNDYEIDATLTRQISVGWIPADKVGAVLQSYSIAGMCNIFVSPDDKIRVVDLLASPNPVETISQDDQIISFDNDQGFSTIYSAVEVTYKTPRLADASQVLSIDNITIPTGDSVITQATFSNPVGTVAYASLPGSVNTQIVGLTYGTQSIDVEVSNTGAGDEIVSLVVYGNEIQSDGAVVHVQDDSLYSVWPDKVLSIENDFIQSKDEAQTYASSIIKLASNPQAIYRVSVRGNPALEVMDAIKVQGGDFIKVAQDITSIVLRQTLTYDGGLSGELLLRDPLV